MVSRDTRTGSVLEQMIIPSLNHGGYSNNTQVNIGTRLGGDRHVVDVLEEDREGNKIIISLKWQQVGNSRAEGAF